MQETDATSIFKRRFSRRGVLATAGAMAATAAVVRPERAGAYYSGYGSIPIAPTLTAVLYSQLILAAFYYQGLTSGTVVQDPSLAGPGGSIVGYGDGNSPYFNAIYNGNNYSPSLAQQQNVQYLVRMFYQLYDELTYEWDDAYYNAVVLGGYLPPSIRPTYDYDSNSPSELTRFNDMTYNVYGKVLPTVYFPSTAFSSAGGFLSAAKTVNQFVISVFLRAVRDLTVLAPTLGAGPVKIGSPTPGALQAMVQVLASNVAQYTQDAVILNLIAGTPAPPDNFNYVQDTLGEPVAIAGSNLFSGPFAPYTTSSSGTTGYALAPAVYGGYEIWRY